MFEFASKISRISLNIYFYHFTFLKLNCLWYSAIVMISSCLICLALLFSHRYVSCTINYKIQSQKNDGGKIESSLELSLDVFATKISPTPNLTEDYLVLLQPGGLFLFNFDSVDFDSYWLSIIILSYESSGNIISLISSTIEADFFEVNYLWLFFEKLVQ